MEPLLHKLIIGIRTQKNIFLSPDEYQTLSGLIDPLNPLSFDPRVISLLIKRIPELRLAPDNLIKYLPYRIKGVAEYFIYGWLDRTTVIILTVDVNPIKIINNKNDNNLIII